MTTCKHCKRCKNGCDFCSCCGKCQRCDNHRCVPTVTPGPTFYPVPNYPAPTWPPYHEIWWTTCAADRTVAGGAIGDRGITFTSTLTSEAMAGSFLAAGNTTGCASS